MYWIWVSASIRSDKAVTYPKRASIGSVDPENPSLMTSNENSLKHFPDAVTPEEIERVKRSPYLNIGPYVVLRKLIKDSKIQDRRSKKCRVVEESRCPSSDTLWYVFPLLKLCGSFSSDVPALLRLLVIRITDDYQELLVIPDSAIISQESSLSQDVNCWVLTD